MSDNLLIALVAAGSAVIGSVLTTLFAPRAKWQIEQQRQAIADEKADKDRKRDLVRSWRETIALVSCREPTHWQALAFLTWQAPYQSLEPLLGPETRRVIAEDDDSVDEYELPIVLACIRDDIARIEREWGLV